MAQNGVMIGIDLGTTFTCCCFYNPSTGKHEVIRFLTGESIIPTSVDFNKKPVVVGVPNPKAITEVKRIIGLKYDDPKVQEAIDNNYFNFAVVEDNEGFCEIEFHPENSNEIQRLKPEEVLAIFLRGIKMEMLKALRLTNDTEIHAVVTVPAIFSHEQRDRMKAAVEMSGMKLVQLFFEPSAAAYAYHEKAKGQVGHYLAFDLGGGTFDSTILKSSGDDERLTYVTTAGDTHLGGLDFDKNFAEKILKIWAEEDPEFNFNFFKIKRTDTKSQKIMKPQGLFRLRKLAEKAKIELSTKMETEIDLSQFYNGDEFMLPVTRQDFEECNQHLFDRCIDIVRQSFRDTRNVRPSSIKEVMLIGGSSRIPKIQEMLREEFPQAKMNDSLNCGEVVAMGASMFCKVKMEEGVELVGETVVHDIYMLGINGPQKIVEKDSPLPYNDGFYTEVHDVEAYSEFFEETRSLGRFTLKPIPRGEEYIWFNLQIQNDGFLEVTGRLNNGTVLRASCSVQRKSNDVQQIVANKRKIDEFFNN